MYLEAQNSKKEGTSELLTILRFALQTQKVLFFKHEEVLGFFLLKTKPNHTLRYEDSSSLHCSTSTPLTSLHLHLQSHLPLMKSLLCSSQNYFNFSLFLCFKSLDLGSFQLLSSFFFYFLIFSPLCGFAILSMV